MKKYQIELNLEKKPVNERMNISKEFDIKIIHSLSETIIRERKKGESISCTDTILELKDICSNDNEFAYLCMQIGRVFENHNIEDDIIRISFNMKNVN